MAKRKPKVLIIGTGGAISAKKVDGRWKYGEISAEELIKNIPQIQKEYELEITHLFRMDSSDIQPEQWLTLANFIYYRLKNYDGVVVTMGTDTLAYAATAISFLIQNLPKPIVFTGSKTDPLELNTDSYANLRQAIMVAAQANIAETVIVFDGKIMLATRAKKINASEYGTFASFGAPEIGKIQQLISLSGKYKKRSKVSPQLHQSLETKVAILKVYPGFDGNRIKHLVDYGARGIILEGYGLGNLPLLNSKVQEGLEYANEKKVPVAIASDCSLGEYWNSIYETEIGKRLTGLHVIPLYDMITETAYVKMMWVMGQTEDMKKVREMMQKNYSHEITVPKKNGGK